ncbi:MAG: hypothetical protein KQI35_09585 [Bacteroidetes bacterium]|nr:hypothetical protein [Bacteroidota bacterium]
MLILSKIPTTSKNEPEERIDRLGFKANLTSFQTIFFGFRMGNQANQWTAFQVNTTRVFLIKMQENVCHFFKVLYLLRKFKDTEPKEVRTIKSKD